MPRQAERWAVASATAAAAALTGFVGLRGLRLPAWAAAPLALALAVVVARVLAPRLPESLNGLRGRRPWLSVAWAALALLAVAQTARQSRFMLHPEEKGQSVFPGDPWYVAHCCLTAYSEAARLAGEGDANLYRPEHYRGFSDGVRQIDGFNVDLYHYPPTFLLLPLVARAATGGGFLALRELWFGVTGLALLFALAAVASRLEPEARLRAIATSPAIWLSMPVQVGLQMSNVQILVVSISAIAWAFFPRRWVFGAALLASAIVSKIFPGILGVYLLFRRRWRDALWTAAFGIVAAMVAYALFGPAPFRAFVEFEMPRLSSGQAFERPFSRPFAVAHNMAPFGIPLKLARLGFPQMGLAQGKAVSTVYGLILVALALRAARRAPRSELESFSVWIALLSLATLASPFAPVSYVLFSLVWLACVDRENIPPLAAAGVWLCTSLPFLSDREGPFLARVLMLLPAQLLALGLPALVLWRAGRRQEAPA